MATMQEIQKALETAALPKVGMRIFEPGYIKLILNSDTDHMGADIRLDKLYRNLEITIFYRDPYRVIGEAFIKLTRQQVTKITEQLKKEYAV